MVREKAPLRQGAFFLCKHSNLGHQLFYCKKLPKNERNIDDFCQIRYNEISNNADGTKGFYPNANDVNEKGRL